LNVIFIPKIFLLRKLNHGLIAVSKRFKTELPTHIKVNAHACGLSKDSIVLLEQVRTLDKKRLKEKMGNLNQDDMFKIDKALSVSFGLT